MVNINGKEFYLDEFLKQKLDTLREIVFKKNWDGVILIDGMERVGKSTLGITVAYYLSDGNFSVKNICADSDDAIKKIESFPDKSVLLIDEGSLVFNSKDAMKKEQKKLIKILNVVGQKNMIFIIILPSIFDLNKSIAIRRSKFLLHCYTDASLNRGRFAYFGEDAKKILYVKGKENYDSYQYPKRSLNELGRYMDFNPLGEEYLETKRKSLSSALHEDDRPPRVVAKDIIIQTFQRVYDHFQKNKKISVKDLSDAFGFTERTGFSYLKYKFNKEKDEGLPENMNQEQYSNNPLKKDDEVSVEGVEDGPR